MKKRKNIPAIICLSVACVLLVLSGLVTLIAQPEISPETESAQIQEAQKTLDSALSDASKISIISTEPTKKASINSFDFSGKIVDGKVQGAEASEKAQPTQEPEKKSIASQFDFHGVIVDGQMSAKEGDSAKETANTPEATATPSPTKASIMSQFDFHGKIENGEVVTGEAEKNTDNADEIPETEKDASEAAVSETEKEEISFFVKAANFLHPFAGYIALAGLVFLGLGIIFLIVLPIVWAIEKDKLTNDNIKSSDRVLKMFILAPNKWLLYLIIVIIVALIIGWSSSSIEWKGFASKGSEVAYGIVYGITHPDMTYILSLGADKVPYLLLETIAIALLGTLIGGVVAVPVAFMASENVVPKWLAFIIRSIILAIRTIPSFVWALCWIRVTGPGAFCGVLTQSLCSIGMISKMYITAIEDLDTKILESLDASGCTVFQKIRYGIIPQLTANFVSTIIYRFDINLKDATTLGIVGAGGIGAALIQAISSRRWSIVGSFLFGMIILMMIIEFASTKIRAKLARG